ncbi:MAG: ribosome maturation factor RimM [Chloroflexota bacterium]|nr:ribosome maturation factor RimM [Chloroflexota bacterium]
MKLESVVVGRVVAPWGVKGEMKVEVMTDFPERFSPDEHVYIEGRRVAIEKSRWHKGTVILKLAGIETVEAAEALRGQFLEVPRAQLQALEEGEFYEFQIVGLAVWTTGGRLLGRVERVLRTGNNDVYVVAGEGGEVLIPAIDDVVKSVDLDRRRITVEAKEGLLPE